MALSPSDPSEKYPENTTLRFPIDAGCFGCGQSNEAGLQMSFERRGQEIVADYTFAERFHGAPGVAHGGIVATLIDEVACATVFFLKGSAVVTGELTVRYEAPCPVEAPISARGRILDDSHAKYAVVETVVEQDGNTLVRSKGKFFYSALVGEDGEEVRP